MPRNRTIYNVLALYASQVPASGMQTGINTVRQLGRVQSFDEDFSRNFTDVNQFGNLASIDRIETEAPTVNASMSYYLTDGLNERLLGLTAATTGSASNSSCISGLLTKTTDEKNYYLLIADEGNDAAGYTNARSGVIAVGNAYITSYSVNAAIGDIPTATVDLEALNVRIYSNLGDASATLRGTPSPAVDPINGQLLTGSRFRLPQASAVTGVNIPTALLPGDITFTPTGILGFDNTDLKVQDFTLTVDLARTPLQRMGSRFAFSREIDFPVTATLEMNAEVGDIQGTGDLSSLLCDQNLNNFTITMRRQACGGTGTAALTYEFKGAKLTSQSFSSAIGDNATMSATFEVQVGSAQQTDRGIFISGSYDPFTVVV
jgi:hypothetical protein